MWVVLFTVVAVILTMVIVAILTPTYYKVTFVNWDYMGYKYVVYSEFFAVRGSADKQVEKIMEEKHDLLQRHYYKKGKGSFKVTWTLTQEDPVWMYAYDACLTED